MSLQGEPRVTVVVPAYNHEQYVAECIESVLDQEFSAGVELIVINDGSTDGTDARIRDFIKADGRVFTYINREDNRGLIKTLNQGLRMGTAKYFCELASDDLLIPGSIQKRVELLEANPDTDVVFCDAYLMEGSVKTEKRLCKGNEKYDSPDYTIENIIEGKARMFFASGMFKKEVIDRLGGFDEDFRFYEDLAMKYRLAQHAKIEYLNEPVMYYRRHGTNVSVTNRSIVRHERVLALKNIDPGTDRNLKKLIKRHLRKETLKGLRVK